MDQPPAQIRPNNFLVTARLAAVCLAAADVMALQLELRLYLEFRPRETNVSTARSATLRSVPAVCIHGQRLQSSVIGRFLNRNFKQ
jgi:hypothetical protein